MVTAPPIFADVPILSTLPDIPQYYANVRGVSFIVDLVLLTLVFAELLKEAGRRANLPTRASAIIGLVLGATITFAIHATQYTLLQHWLTGFIAAIVAGTAAYLFTKEHWGKAWAVLFGIFIGMVVLGIAKVFLGETMRGLFSLLVLLGIIALIIALISGIRTAAGGGGRGGGGGGGVAPDMGPILDKINQLGQRMDQNFTQQGETLGRVEAAITKINDILTDVLQRLDKLEGFFTSWQEWFTKVDGKLEDIKTSVLAGKQLLENHISAMGEWRNQWNQFSKGVNDALTALKAQLENATKQLGDIVKGIADIGQSQERIEGEIKNHDRVLADLQSKIAGLPILVQQALGPEFAAVVSELRLIKSKLGALSTIRTNVNKILELVQKWEAPAIQDIINKIEASKQDIINKIKELNDRLNDVVKGKGADANQIIYNLGVLQNAGHDINGNISDATNVINGLKDLGPRLTELLKSYGTLKGEHEESQQRLKTWETMLKDFGAKIVQAMEQARREEAVRAAPAAAEEAAEARELTDLDTIENAVNQQLTLMQDVMEKVREVIIALTATLPRRISTKATEEEWKTAIQAALNIALQKAKVNIDELRMGAGQITSIKNVLERARKDVQAHLALIGPREPDEQKQLQELDQLLKGFEQFEDQLFALFSNLSETLSTQAIEAIKQKIQERVATGEKKKDIKQVDASYIIGALQQRFEQLAKAINIVKVIWKKVTEAKKKKRERQARRPKRPAPKPSPFAGRKQKPLPPYRGKGEVD